MHSVEPNGDSRGWQAWRARWADDDPLFVLGVAIWLIALALKWPAALSFGDEVGYLGQAKLFLEGRIHPTPDSPGVWNATDTGAVAQYPLLVSVLLAPLFALTPAAIFSIGALSAVALAWTASRILKSWGVHPCWGLIFLAHPTVIILARTVMSDLLLSAFALGAWWTLRGRRAVPTAILLAGTMATRPTGVVLAAAIVAGEALEALRRPPHTISSTFPVLRIGIPGFLLGLVLGWPRMRSTGTIWFGYSFHKGLHPFRLSYFWTSAPAHARSLLLNPPLLVIGLVPLWRRRLLAPLAVVLSLGALMSFYLFVDWAPSWLETLVLAERLILPIVAFLLIGYAAVLSKLATRFGLARIAIGLLIVGPGLIAFKISARHRLWQEPMRQAREAAIRMAKDVGSDQLGLTYGSSKAGLLFPGRTSWMVKDGPRPPLLLCATHGNSYRAPESGNPDEDRCDAAGYHDVKSLDGYRLMLRDGVRLPSTPPR